MNLENNTYHQTLSTFFCSILCSFSTSQALQLKASHVNNFPSCHVFNLHSFTRNTRKNIIINMMKNQGIEKLKDLVKAVNGTDHKEISNTVKPMAQILRNKMMLLLN